ncbi:MAG: hypothetical protein ACP5NW_05860 [Candidatus Woesearchaeota archaeon]
MKKILSVITIFSMLLMVFVLAGCEKQPTTPPNITLEGSIITSGNETVKLNTSDIKNDADKIDTSEKDEFKNVSYTINAVEGDLVTLKLKAVDPDGMSLKYYYAQPFNDQGLWQTEDGDAGKYLVRVSASDSFATTTADVLVIIAPRNKPPVIDCPDEVVVKEGETVNLNCNFFDKENDPITTEYTGWMTSPTYTTNFDSAGDHKVLVRASDGNNNATKTVTVMVKNVPRAPIFEQHLKDMTVTESDIITLKPSVSVPDIGEKVVLKYSEPFDANGVWKTQVGDAGTYPITVVATSQGLSTKETFTLTVKMLNTAPVMKLIANISVDEGETVKIIPEVADREKDPITITFSGWMKDSTYTTTYDDAYPKGCDRAGCIKVYKVTVTASDGVYSASQDVYVSVTDKNRPPVFIWP